MLSTNSEIKRLPSWLKKPVGRGEKVDHVRRTLRGGNLNTVCEEARCPNLGECFERKTATFMILGGVCTRNCGFCSVKGGQPTSIDADEPLKIAEAAKKLELKYAVITSVTRDDLPDGGADHFAATIREMRRVNPGAMVEVLTPDFGGNEESIEAVCQARPDVFNHNVETVTSLYGKVRPGAKLSRSLDLIGYVKENHPGIATKSGFMLGFGEKKDEVLELLEALKEAGCDLVTVGQYMQPTRDNLPVVEYVAPEIFDELATIGKEIGFDGVYSGPLVRSSYKADIFKKRISGGRRILQN